MDVGSGADRDDDHCGTIRIPVAGPLFVDVGFAERRCRRQPLDSIERQRIWRPGPRGSVERVFQP
jgi:hypothetical protein